MGHAIERFLLERGHEVVCTIDAGEENKFDSREFATSDVAIEFTRPDAALANYRRAFAAGVPVVSGTTGWTKEMETVRHLISQEGATLLVNLVLQLGRVRIGILVEEKHERGIEVFPPRSGCAIRYQHVENRHESGYGHRQKSHGRHRHLPGSRPRAEHLVEGIFAVFCHIISKLNSYVQGCCGTTDRKSVV